MHVIDKGAGTAVILLHGFGVDHRILLPLDPVIEASGPWRRVYIDLPGHGLSSAGDVASTMDVISAVRAEILARVDGQPFALVGNSYGGMIARYLAHDLREKVLGLATIASPFVGASEERRLPGRTVLTESAAACRSVGEIGESYAAMAVVQTPENARAFADHVFPGIVAADQAAMDRIGSRYGFATEPEEEWPALFTEPALFVAGRQDHVVGYRDAWEHIEHYPRATFAVLDAAGHNVHLDQPAVTQALVTDWLSKVARG